MNAHVRIGDNRIFSLKQAVLLYQEGSRTFATLHEVKRQPEGAAYLCAGQSVTTGFLETLASGLGAKIAGLAFVVELDFLKGREKLAKYDVFSLLHYDR